MNSTIVFVRHGEADCNIVRQFDKHNVFSDLTARGREQARITGEWLVKWQGAHGSFKSFYSSYYLRATQTAQEVGGIFSQVGILVPNIIEDALLAEANRGIYHSFPYEEVARLYPGELDRKKKEGKYHHRPLGGENWPDVEVRVRLFLDMLYQQYSEERILVFTHSNWLYLLKKILLNISPWEIVEEYDNKETFANASVLVCQEVIKDGGRRLIIDQGPLVPWEGRI